MATSRVSVTEGSGKNLSTYSHSEDAVTKELSRVSLNNSSGTEVGTTTNPLSVNASIPSAITANASIPGVVSVSFATVATVPITGSVSGSGIFSVLGTTTLGSALPAGDNNIGNVDIVTLPALPAGTNNIGYVNIATGTTLPVMGTLTVNASIPNAVVVNASVPGTVTVQATNLDIRDLSSASDSVAAAQSGTWNVGLSAGSNFAGYVGLATSATVPITGSVSGSGIFSVLGTVTLGAGGASDGAIVDGSNGAIKATVLDYTSSNPLAVRLTDTNGDYIAAGAGTQYTEGDVDTTVSGTAAMWKGYGGVLQTSSHFNPLPVDTHFDPGTIDEFGHLVTGSVNNQIDIQFYRSDGSVGDLVTETNANGGTASSTLGMATFSATTTANSQAKGVTTTSTTYTAGAEIYTIFTAGWTGTGSGTSYQRIGLYDTNNGMFIGFEGGTFKATVRKGAVDVGVAKASFSVDTLTGASTSRFTRNGIPEAIDLTKLNVFRIRFGWVGSAPINFEVLSPDGDWVTFHKILQPNLSALPHINTADLPITCDVNSGNSGAALTLITNCWAAGTTQALVQLNGTRTLLDSDYAQLTRSVITGESSAGGGSYVNVKVSAAGALETNAVQSGTWNVGLNAGTNNIGFVNIATSATLSVSGTLTVNASIPNAIVANASIPGAVTVNASIPNAITVNASIPNPISLVPRTSGGWSSKLITAMTSAATISVVGSQVGGYYLYNPNASLAAYAQFFDSSGAVTLGTTAPTEVAVIPPSSAANLEILGGIPHTNGIQVAATTGWNTTTVSPGLVGFVLYK